MHPSSRLLTPGFMKRSLDEFKRLSNIGGFVTVTGLPVEDLLHFHVFVEANTGM